MSTGEFIYRHIGPREHETQQMLKKVGVSSLDELIEKTIPSSIRLSQPLNIPDGLSEFEFLKKLKDIAGKNKLYKTYIGLGFYNTICPSVIQRNIFENPDWYTSYTPYQSEISQGRLEALLNFQTMIMDLTGMDVANASLLDDATAAAEAMIMLYNVRSQEQVDHHAHTFFIDQNTFPHIIDVLKTRSAPLGIDLLIGDFSHVEWTPDIFAALVQYPSGDGEITDYRSFVEKAHAAHSTIAVVADLMSLVLLTPPGEWGADVVVGSSQRFGIPMGFGGPSAAFFATFDKYKRSLPGRIIGVSKDSRGKLALRMALQTREQHIKRERATSNICTAQALLATMAGMYAVYHGKTGLKRIAENIHQMTGTLCEKLESLGFRQGNASFFDTLKINLPENMLAEEIRDIALEHEINLRYFGINSVGISIDETTTIEDINHIVEVFAIAIVKKYLPVSNLTNKKWFDKKFERHTSFLELDLFKRYHSETEMMRYIKKLERKDISLTHSMISLGSCTMKMNAATEMIPLSWVEFSGMHPFVPIDQSEGYHQLITELGKDLCEITRMSAISFEPNSGAAGEYAGLMVIRQYHIRNGQGHKNVALIPSSAHGTNPASAAMAGMKVEVVTCDENGNVDIADLEAKAKQHREKLSCCMITYPSTHGVFENGVKKIVELIHANGGLVYMDGANMNAQVGLTSPGNIGVDVCHLNLHKTFAIPHGGGGPGMGPICVAEHLVEFLPTHSLVETGGIKGTTAVSASPYGSASILVISYAYIKMLGGKGLTAATKYAILNANYLSACLKDYYKVLYTGEHGFVAHEMILDCRNFKPLAEITETDIAKRLMDYGFHAPTLSFPVHGTLMIEPTESESLQELNRFVDTMKQIYEDIQNISGGKTGKIDNVLKNAPHTMDEIVSEQWNHPYSREEAVFPFPWVRDNKFWPTVNRVDDAYGDRNFVCSCAPVESYRNEMK